VMHVNLLIVYAALRRFWGYDATITTILQKFFTCTMLFWRFLGKN